MQAVPAPSQLKCEYAVNPVGIDAPSPRLFWQLADRRPGARQTAYQIIAGSELGGDDLWDSGKVASDATTQIVYGGATLRSRQRIYWRVRYWDGADRPSAYSSVSFFETGLLAPTDWIGQWISHTEKEHPIPGPAISLRKSFAIPANVLSARLYITARGVYVPHLNGQRIGHDHLTPGWTDYNIRIRYQTYDVSEQLRKGQNTIDVTLGDGWYAGHMTWKDRLRIYGDRPSLLAQLHITLDDGQELVIRTDASWQATNTGPIVQQSFLHGDTLDLRKKLGRFVPVASTPLDSVRLIAQAGPTVQQTNELPAIDSWKLPNGDYVFDLGQNMVGTSRLTIRGKAGQKITLKHGEILNGKDDRSVYLTNLRSAKNIDTYILSGKGIETLQPVFALHGFRYVQVSGLRSKPALSALSGIVFHSATAPTGRFSCGHKKLNQLQSNITWGQKGNFIEVPTDCPQRDERLGWMGDAQVFVRTACFNMDVAAFFNRWMLDVADAQLPDGAFTDVVPDILSQRKMNSWGSGAPAWGDAGVICPWTIYQCYGDTRIMENQYASMCKYIDYLDRRCGGGLHPDFGYGDWLAIGSTTSKELIGTAYSAYSISLMRKIAQILGKSENERRFSALFEHFKATFNREFVTPSGRLFQPSQTSAVLALRFGLVDEPVKTRLAKWLADDIEAKGVITTGFVGCNLILPTLTQIGRDDLAWKLLTNEKFPSWLFSVNQGATTIWERWDGWTPEKGFQDAGMNSFNHYAYGSCGQWMYANLGGIETDESAPGFKRLTISPVIPTGLNNAAAEYQTLHGVVKCAWKRTGDRLEIKLTIPANTTAAVRLPGVYVSGADREMLKAKTDRAQQLELPAGSYRLISTL